jgi:hypothetical protein
MEDGSTLEARDGASDDTSVAVFADLDRDLGYLVEAKLLDLASGEPETNKLHATAAGVEHDASSWGPPEPPQGTGSDSQPDRDACRPLPELEPVEVVGQAKRRRDAEQPPGKQE